MPSPEPILLFTSRLRSLGLKYMVSGGVAAMFYGEPRLTNGVDIILSVARQDADRLPDAFPEDEFYCPPKEVLRLELQREQRGHFNLIHQESGLKADIYVGGRDKLHAWGLARVVEADFGGEIVTFAPPEYVVARKLQFFREGGSPKHLRDINRMLVGLGEDWDRAALMEIVGEYGLSAEWQMACAQVD
jgi:hypothetical protein